MDLYCTFFVQADESGQVVVPARLGLSLQYVDSHGAYLLDTPDVMYLLLGEHVGPAFLQDALGVTDARTLGPDITDVPDIDSITNERLRAFINQLQVLFHFLNLDDSHRWTGL